MRYANDGKSEGLRGRLEAAFDAFLEKVARIPVPAEIGVDAATVAAFFRGQREAMINRVIAKTVRSVPIEEEEIPQTPEGLKARYEANLAAMRLVAENRELTPAEQNVVRQFSGWGGLDKKVWEYVDGKNVIAERVRAVWPKGFAVPEKAQLIWEYYTPRVVAKAVASLLHGWLNPIVAQRGVVTALEPSAGIGRFIEAFPRSVRWTAVEPDAISQRLLQAGHPDATVLTERFEAFAAREGGQEFDLWISNPPYGNRPDSGGDPLFKSDTANYHYFLKRAATMVRPGGIAFFLIPTGFLRARKGQFQKLREWMLKRFHLLCAFRLPGDIWDGGARIVVDAIFLERRAGTLEQVAPGDTEIVSGDYFTLYPHNVLGVETYDEARGQRAHQVEGVFTDFGPWNPRPIVVDLKMLENDKELAEKKGGKGAGTSWIAENANLTSAPHEVRLAAALGLRARHYFGLIADRQASVAAAEHPNLLAALQAWWDKYGSPHDKDGEVVKYVRVASVSFFLSCFDKRGVVPGLKLPPEFDDAIGPLRVTSSLQIYRFLASQVGERKRSGPTIAEIIAHARKNDVLLLEEDVRGDLESNGYCYRTDGGWVPETEYYSGDVWDRIDECEKALANEELPAWDQNKKDVELPIWQQTRFRLQAAELRNRAKLVEFAEIQGIDPRQTWIPPRIVMKWYLHRIERRTFPGTWGYNDLEGARDTYGQFTLKDHNGVWDDEKVREQFSLKELGKRAGAFNMASAENLQQIMGFLRNQASIWHISTPAGMTEGEGEAYRRDRRMEFAKLAVMQFAGWVAGLSAEDQAEITEAYNRAFRGYIDPDFSGTEPVARWDFKAVPPYSFQWASARRLLNQRGGLLCLDVGLGKTYTSILGIAIGKHRGEIRRPAVIVPPQVAMKWRKELQKAIPGITVEFIGIEPKLNRHGRAVASRDTAEQRIAKLRAFQAGLVEVLIFTQTAFDSSQIAPEDAEAFFKSTLEVQKLAEKTRDDSRGQTMAQAVKQAERELAKPGKKPKKDKDEETARREALMENKVGKFLAGRLEKDASSPYDGGPTWAELGIDCLIVDEAQNFKNLYAPESNRVEGIPKFMGAPAQGSKRAWQLAVRSFVVRNAGGQVWLLSATPAKNSPMEFYSLISYAQPGALARMGITNPEAYIRLFLIESAKPMSGMTVTVGDIKVRAYISGFKNLDDFRLLLKRTAEFKWPEDVRNEMPIPVPLGVPNTIFLLPGEEQKQVMNRIRGEIAEARMIPQLRFKLLGLLAKMAVATVHPDLVGRAADLSSDDPEVDRGKNFGYEDALEAVKHGEINPRTTRYITIAQRVKAKSECGHIIFSEMKASHAFIRACLIDEGIDPARIVVMNGETVGSDAAKKQMIAEQFNGTWEEEDGTFPPPKYDVVIANGVVYEGIDLQRRTCEIHHADLPWEPATLQQRNGRGVRQGNTYSVVGINYYIMKRSTDALRYSTIEGKRSWLGTVLQGTERETNNPSAAGIDPELEALLLNAETDEEEEAVRRIHENNQLAMETGRSVLSNTLKIREVAKFFAASVNSVDQDAAARFHKQAQDAAMLLESLNERVFPAHCKLALGCLLSGGHAIVGAKYNVLWDGMVLQRGAETIKVLPMRPRVKDPEGSNIVRWAKWAGAAQEIGDRCTVHNGSEVTAPDDLLGDRWTLAEDQTIGFPHAAIAAEWGGIWKQRDLSFLSEDDLEAVFEVWQNGTELTAWKWTGVAPEKYPYPVFKADGSSGIAYAQIPATNGTLPTDYNKKREWQEILTKLGTLERIDKSRLICPTYRNFWRWLDGLKEVEDVEPPETVALEGEEPKKKKPKKEEIPFAHYAEAAKTWFARGFPSTVKQGAAQYPKPPPKARESNADARLVAKVREAFAGDPVGALMFAARFTARPQDVL